MLTIPKKSIFESESSYLQKVTATLESAARLDLINAHFAAQFLLKSRALKMGDYRYGNGPDLVVTAVKKIINQSGDVSVPGNIKSMLETIEPKKK